jgi:hypothetical protein
MTDFAYLGNGSLNTVLYVTSDSPKTAGTSTNILIDNSASTTNFVLNLPTAAGIAGRVYKIRRTDILSSTNITIVTPNGSETIGNVPAWRLFPAESLEIISNGTNWNVIDHASVSQLAYYRSSNSTNDRRYIAGYSGAGNSTLTTSTTAPAIDTLWVLPLVVPRIITFDTITFRVSTGGSAGSVARAGIYRDNGNAYPGALIFDTGSIATTGATAKDTTITAGLQVFQPGLYWLAWECGVAAPQIYCLSTANGLLSILGHAGAWGSANTGGYGYSVSHSFGNLPDPYTAGGALLQSIPGATVPIIAVGLRPI